MICLQFLYVLDSVLTLSTYLGHGGGHKVCRAVAQLQV